MPPKAKAAGKGRGPAKRKLAEEFPPGEVLTDTGKKSWKLGAPIGQGGFGLLYLADDSSAKVVGPNAPYVVKVEPSDNGPLFCELKFYMLAAKPELIVSWMKSRKMKYLGVPKYWGSGLHERGGKRFRFMVMERFGTDLQKKFEEGGKRFPRKLVLQLGLRLLDILEYIHEHEYVHADIKASNLLLSHSNPNQVYLVDYGLAYRYSPQGIVKEYREDPKRCHDGTIEFTSIDAHKGVFPCRRGDLEILGYCMVQWLCGRLPWEDNLQDPVFVRDSKLRCRENLTEFMSQCFSAQDRPDELQKYMEEVKALGFADKPPYDKLRSLLRSGLKSIGATDDDKLEFSMPLNGAGPSSSGKMAVKRKKDADAEDGAGDTDEAPAKKKTAGKAKEANGVRPKKRGSGAKKPAAPKKTTTPVKGTTPKKSSVPTKAVEPAAGQVEMATQTTPGLEAKRARGRPRKNN